MNSNNCQSCKWKPKKWEIGWCMWFHTEPKEDEDCMYDRR